jgi:hypothetical protein
LVNRNSNYFFIFVFMGNSHTMKCDTCHKQTSHIKAYVIGDNVVEMCTNCSSLSEAGGTRTDGLLTRNRLSVRRDSLKHEGDMIVPHVYDRTARKLKPSLDFLKKYPEKAGEYFSRKDLDGMGYNKLKAEPFQPGKKVDTAEHVGDATERIKELVKTK